MAEAAEGEAALDVVNAGRPGLVVVEPRLLRVGQDGAMVVRRLVAVDPRVRVIAYTGPPLCGLEEGWILLQAGVRLVVDKPDLDELITAARELAPPVVRP